MIKAIENITIGGLYALCDPDTARIAYVGQTRNFKSRFQSYDEMASGEMGKKVREWLHLLSEKGVYPIKIKLAEFKFYGPYSGEVTAKRLDFLEREAIARYRETGEAWLNTYRGRGT